jgi:PAS domain S-box-containing protein
MTGHPLTIVIVDDAPDVRVLVRSRLRLTSAFRVVGEGADGAEAVTLAQQHRPDMMLLDVSMPGVDGLEALPRVLAASPATRVVLYTGFEEHGLAARARELGATAFIEKSVSVDALVERLLAVATVEDRSPQDPQQADTGDESDDRILQEHLERFREVFEEAAIGMATMTLTGRLVRANRALAGLVGRPVDELVGESYAAVAGDGEALGAALRDILESPVDVVRLEHGLADGPGDRRVQATLAPVRDSRGRPLYIFVQAQDVTAERAAAEMLRRSEERFRLLVEAVEDYAIFMLDPTGHIVSWNSGAQRSKGYTAEEIVGQHFRVFYPPELQESEHPEHELEIALRVGHYEEEGWRVRKDGSRFWANVLITAVFNADGEHVGFAKVTRDSTRRRATEEERIRAAEALGDANAQLEELNQRLNETAESRAQFLAVTAHELRTPIGVLAGSADTLSQYWDALDESERTELLEAMGSSTSRLRRLLADLLTASRLEARALQLQARPVRVRDVVGDAISTVRRTEPGAEIVHDVPDDLVVSADRDRLAQALDNLLTNALRHGAPPVRVSAEPVDESVEIRVSDQGAGVPEELRPRLFDRFATGASKGGTGLGLFIVRELARAHDGDATYEPPGDGSLPGGFVVRIPRVAARDSVVRSDAGR